MDIPGKVNDYNDVKFVILYILDYCKDPVSYGNLNDIIMHDGLVDFFDFTSALEDMVKTGHVKETRQNEEGYYEITPLGISTIMIFSKKVKYHIRSRAEKAAMQILDRKKREEYIRAEHFSSGDNRVVSLSFFEEDGNEFLQLRLNTPNNEQARIICKNFRNHAETIVAQITQILTQKD